MFLVPDDAPSSLKESERTYNKIEVKWKTCLSWNGPQIGFELTALGKKDGVTHEISKPMVYVINFVQHTEIYRNVKHKFLHFTDEIYNKILHVVAFTLLLF